MAHTEGETKLPVFQAQPSDYLTDPEDSESPLLDTRTAGIGPSQSLIHQLTQQSDGHQAPILQA